MKSRTLQASVAWLQLQRWCPETSGGLCKDKRAHLEVVHEPAGALPKGAMVGHHSPALQQQQVVEGLQHDIMSSAQAG